jgi:hypothetical protein
MRTVTCKGWEPMPAICLNWLRQAIIRRSHPRLDKVLSWASGPHGYQKIKPATLRARQRRYSGVAWIARTVRNRWARWEAHVSSSSTACNTQTCNLVTGYTCTLAPMSHDCLYDQQPYNLIVCSAVHSAASEHSKGVSHSLWVK